MSPSKVGPKLTPKNPMRSGKTGRQDPHSLRGIEVRDSRGNVLSASGAVGGLPAELAARINFLKTGLDAGTSHIRIPEMVAIPGMPGKFITIREITIGFWRQVMGEYLPTGNNAKQFKRILANKGAADLSLTEITLEDNKRLADVLNALVIPGRGVFRVPTEAEWEAAQDSLIGDNWTITERPNAVLYVLRHLRNSKRDLNLPDFSCFSSAVARLVEDKTG
ncbi:MAG: hypothetical protein KKB81_00050 [Candidatus Margulisbacteria bacterium]|nr:hypothetical protein [Candidatus Margulisiibacteriota bacterium]MBU1022346.1 hypothetical protein [Candidatus Margulisiibacteriota bacterium]MBU1729102.1 hypothetical protein [Candidatus Margulisiibacteriota bacterium]MBU1954477.1 hypothetical protein [Candidatus Margulisiibacteriota bacterium]